jgi:tetratricopeptide (TPR) repeat protein
MSYTKRKQGSGQRPPLMQAFLVLLGVTFVSVFVLAVLSLFGVIERFPFGIDSADFELIELWQNRDYSAVISQAELILAESPYDGQALTFGGFAHFYIGVDSVGEREQRQHLERAVQLLRKALHVSGAPLEPERTYVLAKAYYHMGDEYMDVSARLMEESLDLGFEASESRSYLGMAYASLGRHEESAFWFERAIENAGSELGDDAQNVLRVRAAETYAVLGRFEEAQRLLQAAIVELDDDFLRLMARNELADVLIQSRRFVVAEEVVRSTIEEFPESADAHYYLGVVYFETERRVEARDRWRTARRIDPNHEAALARLAGNWES